MEVLLNFMVFHSWLGGPRIRWTSYFLYMGHYQSCIWRLEKTAGDQAKKEIFRSVTIYYHPFHFDPSFVH